MATFHSVSAIAHSEQPRLLPTGLVRLMQQIPYDVWRCIADFLPSEEVKKLYSVNRSLLNISMGERYRIAYLGPLHDNVTQKNLNRLIDPEISSHVRDFTFNPGDLCRLLHENKLAVQNDESLDLEPNVIALLDAFERLDIAPRKVQFVFDRPITPASVYSMPIEVAYRNVLRILRQMVHLTTLRIELIGRDHWHFHSASSTFLSVGWSSFGSHLKSLDLKIPLESVQTVLHSVYDNRMVLTSLENLSLQIIRATVATNASVVFTTKILPFINIHSSTLRSLSFDIADQMNLSDVFLRIKPIIPLRSLKLKLPFVSRDLTDLTGLKHFLHTHRLRLTVLHLDIASTFTNYPNPYHFFAQPCFGVTLPMLRNLSIHFQGFPRQYSEEIIPYILQFTETMECLSVSEWPWTLERLGHLLDGLPYNSPLRVLKLRLTVLDPQVIEAIATSLPNLDTLDLMFDSIGPNGFIDPPTNTTPCFADKMHRLSFPTWCLREFYMRSSNHLSHIPKTKCKQVLVSALPNVQWFCGLAREDYLRSYRIDLET